MSERERPVDFAAFFLGRPQVGGNGMTDTGAPAWRAVDRVLAEILGRVAAVEARLSVVEARLDAIEERLPGSSTAKQDVEGSGRADP